MIHHCPFLRRDGRCCHKKVARRKGTYPSCPHTNPSSCFLFVSSDSFFTTKNILHTEKYLNKYDLPKGWKIRAEKKKKE